MIAESAALLLENAEHPKEGLESPPNWGGWGAFISRHRFELGYYSIIPDSHYRSRDGNDGKTEAPCHFFDIDLAIKGPFRLDHWASLEKQIDAFPVGFDDAQSHLAQHQEDPIKLGTSPWRTEQMMDRIWKKLKNVKSGAGKYQSGKTSKDDARALYDALPEIGVLSHYTGDAAMPHHSTVDWNGFQAGHGGIHFYFENECVDASEPGLSSRVLALATKNKDKWLKHWRADQLRPAKIMLEMYADSAIDIEPVLAIDKKSVAKKLSTKGKAGENALRKDPKLACKYFEPLVTERLAKATVLTAALWKWVLPGGVSFSGPTPLKFSDFEFYTDYIQPDYQTASFLETRKPGSERSKL